MLKKALSPDVNFEMLVCVVQCFTCFDAVPIMAKMRVNTKTLQCDVMFMLGTHCDWFWSIIKGNGIIARSITESIEVEVGNDASTPQDRALWARASRNL